LSKRQDIALNMTDNEVIQSIKEGNRNDYRELVERYQALVFRTCMGFVHNKQDAEDLTQEVFIRAWQAIPLFKGESSFATWLYRIAINAALNNQRKTKKSFIIRRIDAMFGSEKNMVTAPEVIGNENPETILIQDEHRKWLQQALNRLPEKQRTVLVLSKYDDLSQKEIASVLNTTEGAVEALLQRAKTNLRKELIAFTKKK
jgi:RNA polymerase sigma-70 factor (ECF subfamily)